MTRPTSQAAHLQGLALALSGAVLFSGKAVVAKLLYREGIDAVTLIALRMLLSLPFFVAIALYTWKRAPNLDRRTLVFIALLGVLGYYVSSMLDFLGLQYVSAGLERLILFLCPSFVLLLGFVAFGRRVLPLQWLSLLLAYAGIGLVVWHDVRAGGDGVVLGCTLVFIGAITYAVYLVFSAEIVARVGSLRLVALGMTAASLACTAQYAVLRPAPTLLQQTPAVWGLSLVNATLCTVLPVLLTMAGVARIGAGAAAQAGTLGPVSTLLLAAWLLGEPITALQLAGSALVIAGILLLWRLRNQALGPPSD